MSDEWLEKIQAGDVVIVSGRWMNVSSVVSRVTPTQIVVDDSRYDRRTGRRRGGSEWDIIHLREATPERMQEIERLKLAKLAREIAWHKYSLEELRQVAKIIWSHDAVGADHE